MTQQEALEILASGTRGIPRLLNRAMHQALTLAFKAEAALVDAEAAMDALGVLGLVDEQPEPANGQSAGQKRQTRTTIADVDQSFLYMQDPTHITCEGDSGGPALAMYGGAEEIVGITSFGDQGCRTYGADTRVDTIVDFVDPYVQQYDPGSGPPDMTGTFFDHPDYGPPPAMPPLDANTEDMASKRWGLPPA